MVRVRVVIDTNTLVPSLYSQTPIYHFLANENLTLLWNNFTKEESHEIINRLAPKYIKKGYTKHHINLIHKACDELMQQCNYYPEKPIEWPTQSADPDDDPFLWVAYVGQAEYLITQDRKHLLKLGYFRGIPIGKPAQFFFWAIMNKPMNN